MKPAGPKTLWHFQHLLHWQVVYNGQSVFHEKPVFICFPENVRLHWSTTLPIAAADLTEDDNLEIMAGLFRMWNVDRMDGRM